MNNFTFVVFSYNHQEYILEHLESIKYQIETYGADRNVDLILADDGSKDSTVEFTNRWISINSTLFTRVIILADRENIGTCYNYTKSWSYIKSNLFKITAADDVYSMVNIFDFSEKIEEYDILSGMPVLLIDGKIQHSTSMLFNIWASFLIYKGNFLRRMQKLSSTHTPSLFFNKRILALSGIVDFIRKFRVVEDFPMQVKIALDMQPLKFHQTNEVIIYYRRTKNSIFLVRENDFNRDKVNTFKYLISCESNLLRRLLLRNRIFCIYIKNKFFRIIFNFNYILYFLDIISILPKILSKSKNFSSKTEEFQKHYDLIRLRSAVVKELL